MTRHFFADPSRDVYLLSVATRVPRHLANGGAMVILCLALAAVGTVLQAPSVAAAGPEYDLAKFTETYLRDGEPKTDARQHTPAANAQLIRESNAPC